MKLEDIDELIIQFRQLGGIFENTEVRFSEDLGYHCYSADSKKNSIISCPASLFVDIDDLGITENGLFISTPEKHNQYTDFLDKYFALQFNRDVVAGHSDIKRQINSLSDDDLSLISDIFPPVLLDLDKYTGLEFEKKRILDSHNIKHRGKSIIMPFVSFVNYSKNGRSFNVQDDKISISGKFNGEILAKYNDDDVLKIASGYHFITDTQYIYSIPLSYQMINGKKLVVNRNTLEGVQLDNGRWKPVINNTDNCVTLSWFPLYMEGAPLYPAAIAKMIADEIQVPAENLIYNILKLNLHALVPAAFKLRESENDFARFLGAAAQRQLETIAATRG